MGYQGTNIIAGVGNEVFYFLLFVLLLLVVVACYSTYMLQPVVKSVIPAKRNLRRETVRNDQIQASSPEEEERRLLQADTIEKRQKENEGLGLKDPEGAKRRMKQKVAAAKELDGGGRGEGGMKWQVG